MKHLPPPTILQIELTKNCNNACIMCHKGQMPEGKDFNRADISDIALEQVKPVYPFLKHAMLFGDGEPMMFKRFWDVVQDIRTAAPECAIDFINNGSQMNKLNADKCLQYQISAIGLSLGGATPKTHAYIRKLSDLNQIIKNFEYLKKIKEKANTKEPYLQCLIVVMKSNVKELPDFIKLADHLGASRVSFQKMFVTHPMVMPEVIEDHEAKPYIQEAVKVAEKLGLGLTHYIPGIKQPGTKPEKVNPNDRIFRQHFDPSIQPKGYCKYQQPWNTVYILHNGNIVPDCHWWASNKKPEFDHCGTLNEKDDILDIWNGTAYQKIRKYIQNGTIMPQCRGCGLAGGVKKEYRSEATDHTSPGDQEKQPLVQIPKHKTVKLQVIAQQSKTKEQQEIYKQICEASQTNTKMGIRNKP